MSEVVAPPTPATVLRCAIAPRSGGHCRRLGALVRGHELAELATEVVGALTEGGEVVARLLRQLPGRGGGVEADLPDRIGQIAAGRDGQQEADLGPARTGTRAGQAELCTPGDDEILGNGHGN